LNNAFNIRAHSIEGVSQALRKYRNASGKKNSWDEKRHSKASRAKTDLNNRGNVSESALKKKMSRQLVRTRCPITREASERIHRPVITTKPILRKVELE